MPDGGESSMKHLLFVDDEPRILDGLRRNLRQYNDRWDCSFAGGVQEAIERLESNPIDVVISDINMPGRSGIELLKYVRDSELHLHTPVLMLTGNCDADVKRQALELGATDFLQKPCDSVELTARLQNVIALKHFQDEIRAQNEALEELVRRRTRELEQSRRNIIICLAKAAETRDTDTGHHITRVALYSQILAKQLGLNPSQQEVIMLASPLHDVGKIGIADDILRKPGPLTPEEREEMQRHCHIGAEILRAELLPTFRSISEIRYDAGIVDSSNELLETASRIALAHHEWYDGSGYPSGLSGELIPQEARIVSICDVYDALRSARPYKNSMSVEQTLAIIDKGSGTQFDPVMVEALRSCVGEFELIRREYGGEESFGMAA